MAKSIYRQRREELTAALRSGDYGQTQGGLRDGNRFCCLGVACDVYHRKTYKGSWEVDDSFRIYGWINNINLPDPVASWYGFITANDNSGGGDVRIPELTVISTRRELNTYLAYLNDQGFTFSQIADIIDYFWPDEYAEETDSI